MDLKMIESVVKNNQELKDSLDVVVKIDFRQFLKIVVNDLIGKRNNPSNKEVESFDRVIKCYLSESEFEKHVINKIDLPS